MQLDQLTLNGIGPDPAPARRTKVLLAPGPSIVAPVTNFLPAAGFASYFVNHIVPTGVT
jgi:hypothetical protein